MAEIRQGYLDDYSQQNGNVGIGTSISNEKLEIIGGSDVTSNIIDFIQIATGGSAQDFGDAAGMGNMFSNGMSDSHGGLGGY